MKASQYRDYEIKFGQVRAIFQHNLDPQQRPELAEALRVYADMDDEDLEVLTWFGNFIANHGLEYMLEAYAKEETQ